MGNKVEIAIISYHNHQRLDLLLENMFWSGMPDIPVTVYEDPCPHAVEERIRVSACYDTVCAKWNVKCKHALKWGCMQGITEFASAHADSEWIIWVPDDVMFPRGALWQEYASVLAFGKPYVGAIQLPYWNANDLVTMGVMQSREQMFSGWQPPLIPRNPFWDHTGVPRAYINCNGAGFAYSTALWREMGGFPRETWRIDEYLGFKAWTSGKVVVTVPGIPRIHYFGGSTPLLPTGLDYHTAEAWERALGMSVQEAAFEMNKAIARLKEGGDWQEIVRFFNDGGSINV